MVDRKGETGPPNPRGSGSQLNAARGMGTYSVKKGAEGVSTPYDLKEGISDNRKPAEMARLYTESMGFENLAGRGDIDARAKAAVLGALNETKQTMEFLRNKWLVLYRLWRGETLAGNDYGRDALHSPEPFKIVETLHPKLMRTLFATDKWFRFDPIHDHHKDNARAQEALCTDQLRETKYRSKVQRFTRDGLIYGTAVQKVYWKQEQDEVCYREGRRVPLEDFPGATKVELTEVKKTEIVYDGNVVDNVSVFDFMTDPTASSIDEAEWCMDRSGWPSHKIKSMGELGHWKNLEALKNHPGQQTTTFNDEYKERKSYAFGIFDPETAGTARHIPHYQVLDWWGPLVIEDKDGNFITRECNVVIVDPEGLGLVVRVTQNPFWHRKKPYQAWRPITVEDEFYGVGALEMIARLSLEKDTKRNLLMASAQLEANPMLMASDEANIPDGQLLARPGLILRVPDIRNAIAPVHIPKVSDAALKAENILTRDIRETAGTSSPTMGAQDPFAKTKTATQHTSEINESNERLVGMIENFEQDVILPMLEQMSWNNQQFLSYARVVRTLGSSGIGFTDRYTIGPEHIIGKFIISPLASRRLLTKTTMVQQMVNLLDRAPVINQMHGPNTVKTPKLLAMILEHGFDIRNVDDYITADPEDLGLISALEEHELWYKGHVAPVREDDNDLYHFANHMKELEEERFDKLEKRHPAIAERARQHAAKHGVKLARLEEAQTEMLMKAMQQQQMMNGGGGGNSIAGAATPGQDPNSPQVRRNETERGDQGGGEEQSEAMSGAPNEGAA